ncbi:MAG: hypothetical protein ABJA67_12985 [Chthonomonadales bacterium]
MRTNDSPTAVTPWMALCFGIICLGALLYFPSLTGSKIWDDRMLLDGSGIGGGSLRNCFVHPFMGRYFRPGVAVTFALERQLWGDNIQPYRMTNLIIHLLNIGAIIGLARSAFGNRRAAAISGLLFAIHPALVSSVAWVGGRTDTLACLWVTLFCWAIVVASQHVGEKRSLYLAYGVGAYLFALFTKEQVLLLPVLVPAAFAVWKPKSGVRLPGDSWVAILPFCLTIFFYLAASSLIGVPHGSPLTWAVSERLLLIFRSVADYGLLLLSPTPFTMHCLTINAWEHQGTCAVWLGSFLLFGTGAIALPLIRRAPREAWFVVLTALAILPVINLIPITFLQLAPYRGCLGVIGIACVGGSITSALTRKSVYWWFPATGVFIWFTGLTVWGGMQWRDEETLFREFLKNDSADLTIRYNLVYYLREKKRPIEAAQEEVHQLEAIFGANGWQDGQKALDSLDRNEAIRRMIMQLKGDGGSVKGYVAWQYAILGDIRWQIGDRDGAEEAYNAGYLFDPTHVQIKIGLDNVRAAKTVAPPISNILK